MRNITLASAMTLAVAVAAPASAQVATYSSTFNFPALVTPVTFQEYGSGAANLTPFVPGSGPIAGLGTTYTESTTGTVTLNTGSVPGQTLDPNPAPGNYLSVQNGSYTVAFSTPLQFFSFIAGSLDSYNTLVLNLSSGPAWTFTGTQLQTLAGGPTGLNTSINGRFSFDRQGTAGIVSAVFSSSQQAFEIDGLAAAVPEPATWAMFILGFGLAGAALRVRRRKVTFATA